MSIVIGDIHGDYRILLEIILNELKLQEIQFMMNDINIAKVSLKSSSIEFQENETFILKISESYKSLKKNTENGKFHIIPLIIPPKMILLGDVFDVGSHISEYFTDKSEVIRSINIDNYKIVSSFLTYKLVEYLSQYLILIYGNHELTCLNHYNYKFMRKFIIKNFRSFYYDKEYDALYTHFRLNFIPYESIISNDDSFFQTKMATIKDNFQNNLVFETKNLLIKQKKEFESHYKIKHHFIGHFHNVNITQGTICKTYYMDVNMCRFKNNDSVTFYGKWIDKEINFIKRINNLFEPYLLQTPTIVIQKKNVTKEEIDWLTDILKEFDWDFSMMYSLN